MANTLEAIKLESVLSAHRSGTDLKDKTPLQNYQAVTVEKLAEFDHVQHSVADNVAAPTSSTVAVQGDVVTRMAGSTLTKFICVGSFGSTIPHDEALQSFATKSGAFGASQTDIAVAFASLTLNAGSKGANLKLKYTTDGSGNLTAISATNTGIGFAAGDTITFTDAGSSSNTCTITLVANTVNQSEWVSAAFSKI
jgi:hypothetical protein